MKRCANQIGAKANIARREGNAIRCYLVIATTAAIECGGIMAGESGMNDRFRPVPANHCALKPTLNVRDNPLDNSKRSAAFDCPVQGMVGRQPL